uniref:hypothetical protein n=1 Tax=Salmonella sp. s51228 TaxID=3159652 RepID=UPI0039801758
KELKFEEELASYINHLTSLISFSWTLTEGENERQGSTSLEEIILTEKMLNILKIEPICFDLQVNEEFILPEDETKFLTGQIFHLSIILSNYTDRELDPFKVQL